MYQQTSAFLMKIGALAMKVLDGKQIDMIVGGMGSGGSAKAQAEAAKQIQDVVDFAKGVLQGFYDVF